MEAVVVGASGLVGSTLVNDLIRHPEFTKVVSIGRKTVKSNSEKISNIIISDLSEISSIDLKMEDSVFFCCLGSTIKKAGNKENFRKVDFHGVVSFARLAKKSNASKFILVSAKGADVNSSFFYNRTKGEAEQAIIEMGLNSTTIFRPGLLLGDRKEFRFFESVSIGIMKGLKSVISYDRLRPFVTSVESLVRAIIDNSLVKETGYKIVDSSEILE
ncbi:MAG: NAD(P)H-binding protein [Bdellovibrionaceae bacterium]|nr:NAD(P)H-binding protein [Pseudobdellovibrionaceae bacterium]